MSFLLGKSHEVLDCCSQMKSLNEDGLGKGFVEISGVSKSKPS